MLYNIEKYQKMGNLPNVDPYDESPGNLLYYGSHGQHAYNQIIEYYQSKCESVPISKLKFLQDPDGVKDQGNQDTCYAYATVTCIRCAQVRLGLTSPQNAQKVYLNRIISQFGKQGAQLYHVLPWILPQLKLRYKKIESNKSTYKEAAKEKTELIKKYVKQMMIPVLIVVQWTKEALHASKKVVNLKFSCHAMVIMGVDGDYWKVQNSWGKDAHEKGTFKYHYQSNIREAYIVYGENDQI